MGSDEWRKLVEYSLVPCSREVRTTETGELELENWLHSKAIEEEMTRRLHSDLK
jgi:hypothetical protein